MLTIRFCLAIVAAVSGLLVCARAFLGPFHFLVPINTPLNLQSIFGLSATLALLFGRSVARPGKQPPIADWVSITTVILIGLAAFWQSLYSSFLSDDFYLVTIAASRSEHAAELFMHGGGKEFFRPVGGLLLALTSSWAGVNPFYWRLSSLLLHLANSVLVFLTARRLSSGGQAALVASVLFAIHGTRPEAVAWVAGRFDLIATFFVLTGILLFIAYRSTRAAKFYLGSLLCMVLGMLSKESAYVFPLLLLAVLAAIPGASRREFLWTWPFWTVALVMFAIRWYALGGIGGYVDESSGRPQVFSFSILRTAQAAALRIWSALYFPINWNVEPALFLAISLTLSVAIMAWLVATVSVERRQVLFGAAFVIISALPALQQLLIGSDLQKSRLLYLPSVGFCLMIGIAVTALRPKQVQLPAILILLLFNFLCLRHNLVIWRDVAAVADSACALIVRQLPPGTTRIVIRELPGSLKGVYFLRNGIGGCLDLNAGRSLGLEVETGNSGSPNDSHTAVFHWEELRKSLSADPPDPAGSPDR